MHKGKGKILWGLSIILIITLMIIGCSNDEDIETGEEEESEEAVMEETDERDNESKSKDDEKELEKTGSEDATGNSDIVEVTSQELQKITVGPYEIEERLVLSGDGDYILTEMPVAPGTVHIISEFEAWKKAYDEMDSGGGPSQPMYWYGSLLKEAWSDSEDHRGDRLENYPVNQELFISSIDVKDVSSDGKNLLYSARMYEEKGKHDGPGSIMGLFITGFETPVSPRELQIPEEGYIIEPFWSSESDVIYYVVEEGLFSYSIEDEKEKLILPSKDLPGLPREVEEESGKEIIYDIYRDEESLFVYYSDEDEIVKISLLDEVEAEIFAERMKIRNVENISVLQEDLLLLSPRARTFDEDTLLSEGKEIGLRKTLEDAQFQDYFISESGDIFLLFTTAEEGAEVQVFDQGLRKEKWIQLPSSFGNTAVLGNMPDEPEKLSVIGEKEYYNLKTP